MAGRVESGVASTLFGLPPVIASNAQLLILGSFPGVASLKARQYYGHPRNHFWPIVGQLLGLDWADMGYEKRLLALTQNGLAVWDVYASCERVGSLDQAIRNASFNNFASLKLLAPTLRHVAHNGGESARAMRHLQGLGFEVMRLPSTSPANATWSLQRKVDIWRAAFAAAGLPVR